MIASAQTITLVTATNNPCKSYQSNNTNSIRCKIKTKMAKTIKVLKGTRLLFRWVNPKRCQQINVNKTKGNLVRTTSNSPLQLRVPKMINSSNLSSLQQTHQTPFNIMKMSPNKKIKLLRFSLQ